MDKQREKLRHTFLDDCGYRPIKIQALKQDASFRRYFRIFLSDQTIMLMDAPPGKEDIQPFVKISRFLASLKLNPPSIFHQDVDNGFIALEDFGDQTFTHLLANNHDESTLYQLANSQLIKLHQSLTDQPIDIQLPSYNVDLLLNEAKLFCDWFYPMETGNSIDIENRQAFIKCWRQIFNDLPAYKPTIVLRDYHVDNLMLTDDERCGLLDFQDAVTGHPAYDLVSLLEDARRDVSPQTQKLIWDQYLSQARVQNSPDFLCWYKVLGVQRHVKVLGIFSRLSIRDNKPDYLKHLPRVKQYIHSHLDDETLTPFRLWLANDAQLKGILSG